MLCYVNRNEKDSFIAYCSPPGVQRFL